MNFNEYISKLIDDIDLTINKSIPEDTQYNIYGPFSYIMNSRGKRLRPLICILSSAVMGANPLDVIKCGAAMEILHNFTLVHDDIMDGSLFRRNKQTVHVKWDEPTAILTGDIMIGYAYNLLPKYEENPNSDRIIRRMSQALIDVCEGQFIDMSFNCTTEVTLKDYYKMVEMKTARLLMASSAIGAMYAGANDKQVQLFENIFYHVGLAFQIQDDLLDMTATERQLGKKVGLDVTEGKKTIMFILAKDIVNKVHDKNLIQQYFASNGMNEEYIQQFHEIFHKYNIYELTQKKIQKHLDEATELFDKLPKNEHTTMLNQLIQKLNKRKF